MNIITRVLGMTRSLCLGGESGAKATAVQTFREFRDGFINAERPGLRRVHRRFGKSSQCPSHASK